MKTTRYFLLIILSALMLSSCTTTKAVIHNFSELAEAVTHPFTPPKSSAQIEEGYDTYLTLLLKGYTIQDFQYINKHSATLAMQNPYTWYSVKGKTYKIILEAASDIARALKTKQVYKLPKSPKLPEGGFYICGGLYSVPIKVKDVMHFTNPNTCNLMIEDYCPSWDLVNALNKRIWQNNHTVFIFNKKGVLQKVVTSYMCPPRQNELEF